MAFEELIETLKRAYENQTGWGDSSTWTNQDFINLSELIRGRTGVTLSHVTLKRIWGKVKYDSLPNTYTLDTLAHYVGFENWRNFVSTHQKNGTDVMLHEPMVRQPAAETDNARPAKWLWITAAAVVFTSIFVSLYLNRKKTPAAPVIKDGDYTFSSKKVVTSGLPNSVIFNYDATKAPADSVIILQSWDRKLQTKVSKRDHQHTSIYYYPDFYKAKLIVNGRIVKQHELFIQSDGWLAAVEQSPVPVYFDQQDIIANGKIGLSAGAIKKRNIRMQPVPPYTLFSRVQDFGGIYSDDFTFETLLRNDYREGAAICQHTTVYLLCKGTAIDIPLCAKGCVSDADLLFTNFTRSGKSNDLSVFGVDFSGYVKLRIASRNRKAQIYINDKPVYIINEDIVRSRIIGIDYRFQGTGSVDHIKLTNGKVTFEDNF